MNNTPEMEVDRAKELARDLFVTGPDFEECMECWAHEHGIGDSENRKTMRSYAVAVALKLSKEVKEKALLEFAEEIKSSLHKLEKHYQKGDFAPEPVNMLAGDLRGDIRACLARALGGEK